MRYHCNMLTEEGYFWNFYIHMVPPLEIQIRWHRPSSSRSDSRCALVQMERSAVKKPAKLEHSSSTKISAKSSQMPKISRSRNPLKDLNTGYLPPSHSREGFGRGCFSLLRTSPASVSSKVNRPRTPSSAPANPRFLKTNFQSRPNFEVPHRSQISRACPIIRTNSEKVRIFTNSSKQSDGPYSEEQTKVQNSKTPTSSKTATPPFQASISPEFSSQSAVPAPACFATGHLLTGIKDRRKCKPRGILNGGNSGFEVSDSKTFTSFISSRKSGSCSTSPLPLGASVQWHPSPCSSKLCPAEASASWVLSPEKDLEGNSLKTAPDHVAVYESPSTSSTLQKTPSSLEICQSPVSSSSLSPFSMILQRASAMPRDRGSCHYLSRAQNPPSSPDTKNNSNVMCTPSCSSSSKKVNKFCTVDSSPVPFPDESFHFGCSLSPLNSADLSRFQRSPLLGNSPTKRSDTKESSSSETRISWREGLISRIFSMHEFSGVFWSTEREGQKFEKVKGENDKLGFGSFEFPLQSPCTEFPGAEEQCSMSSSDSDWTFFSKNQLFED